ncbi:hypothetical protein Barb4_01121 [Bacteroidales bacterium Barb4]|nr:hypothetical protein Barb4_01121 [Bacteroidales bacterium Barb4]
MEENNNLIYKIKIIDGVDIETLCKSLNAINEEFNRFTNNNKALAVKEIRKGSGVFEFFEKNIISVLPLINEVDIILKFAEYLRSIKELFIREKEKHPNTIPLTNKTINNAELIFAPVINGDNNIINFTCRGKEIMSVNKDEYEIFLDYKKTIKLPDTENELKVLDNKTHQKVLFKWIQARFDKSKEKDKGVIDAIQKKAIKVIFADDNSISKTEMTTSSSDTDWQEIGYIVDVETITSNNKVVAYKILKNYPDDSIDLREPKQLSLQL